jgi:hypothetical protein
MQRTVNVLLTYGYNATYSERTTYMVIYNATYSERTTYMVIMHAVYYIGHW